MSLRIALFALGLVVGIPAYGQPSGPQLELFGGGGCLDDVDVAALQVGPSPDFSPAVLTELEGAR